MKVILFCQNAYAFGILAPIRDLLTSSSHDYIWFVSKKILQAFPFKTENYTSSILDLQFFDSDAIFIPGNEVPYYLKGLKVQVFHGLAGEKKGHFRIRHYFDLYLTQGPFFTSKFNELKEKHQDFDVIETGWPKLDVYGKHKNSFDSEKKVVLDRYNTTTMVLYAPTFSPSLTSAPFLLNEMEELAVNTGYLIYIKFHDLMSAEWITAYAELSHRIPNIIFQKEKNIIKFLLQADILISDTSSVIYEFLLLDKPVVSFKNISGNIQWDDSQSYSNLTQRVENNLNNDPFKKERQSIYAAYHPYNDGQSAERMISAVEKYISKNGVPEKRNLSFARQLKIHKIFGQPVLEPWTGEKTEKITALLITFNEINNIEEVLENVSFANEIIVVDSFSSDGTVDKIKEYPKVKLIQRAFKNYTDQKSFAMEQASNDWVLFMDADERLTDGLKNEILKTINSKSNTIVAFMFSRTFMFKNKILRFSGWQSDKNYRLFRKTKVKFDNDLIVHESLIVNGESGVMKNKLIHYSYSDYEDYKAKMIKYGQMKAAEEFKKNKNSYPHHFVLRPVYKFLNHYIIRLGILDGKKGIIICYLNALGVYSRYKELKRLRKQGKLSS
ncbi:CDP-glycerol glycerophosphotransferase family protein [Maribacter sp. HTCC2170]|uniref:CDP-glycerol glycerophosphotransferase family protein n=1 Tax=Maribacter sp. (strain HTCC2170 / KCCM 42371) TaxID=313603 RepID=UPI00006B21A7|nr:CDP-glycerol glycerophosphotransferase family protein [Maribacter sp. HTCC2170]EAR00171.1 CDP-Glycerol:Poly(glycerophosphate) glycerophosphotransferase family protein [Maribacter sp. HTCC2170]